MAGARIVLNSRYFHIAKAGEKADGKHCMTKDAAMGLVNYVGTRESVELNVPNQISFHGKDGTPLNLDPLKLSAEVAARPATRKQEDTIYDLLKEIPEAKNSLEYQDYTKNKTIGNASELISRAAETGLGYAVDLGKAKNLVDYVANRPGVDRVGEHGLFSASPTVDIQKAQEEIANCKGNIWTHVVSLRREDADVLGYDQQKPWRDMVKQKIDTIAKASNIPVSELHWYAGMHNTTHHPHIHLFVFSDNPNAGCLTVEGINQMKSAFSEVIFADERHQIYTHKTEMRNEIKQEVDDILTGIRTNSTNQFSNQELDALCVKLFHLSNDLKGRPGKLQYGWMKDMNIREQVDSIMADLAKAPEIQKLYELYCDDNKGLQQMYRNDPNDIGPLLKNKEFYSIKNKIIRESVKLGNSLPEAGLDKAPLDMDISATLENFYNGGYTVDSTRTPGDQSANDSPSSLLSDDEQSLFDTVPDEEPEWMPPEDYEPPAEHEPPTDHEMPAPNDSGWSKHHEHKPRQASKQDGFEDCLNKAMQGDTTAKYQLAKKYFYGSDVEQDYAQAQMWYGLAAADGHSLAKYELGKMYLYGNGIEKDTELGKEYCLDAYWDFRSSITKAYGFDVGVYIDQGSVIEEGISGAKEAAYLMYCLGRMEHAGEGVDCNYEKAIQWYHLAADGGHVHSNYCLAKMHYGSEGVSQDYGNAKSYYETAAKGHDKYAYHALGKMYDTGTGVVQDFTKAADWFTRASQKKVPYADYRLAQMYEIGQGVGKDEELSGILYRKALDEFLNQEKKQPDAGVEFRIAKMHLNGNGVEQNQEEAAEWLIKCCEKEDSRAQYQLASMYQEGQGIQQDESKAKDLYVAALSGFLKLEQETPGAQVEYKIAGMYARGIGTEPDATQAFPWYVKAAINGHPHAAYCCARACYDGNGTEQDYHAAEKWYLQSSDGGDSYAMYALGKMYRDGTGVEKDTCAAYRCFLAAAKLEHEYAQFAVAKALLNGIGIEENPQEAFQWLSKCTEHDNHYAEYQLAELLSDGKVVPKDEIKAQEFYTAALAGFLLQEQDEPDMQLEHRIGNMFLNGKGTQKNSQEALHWLSGSAEKGNSYAAYQVGQMLEEGKDIPKHELRAQFYYNLALNGFIASEHDNPDDSQEFRIGQMFYQGKGSVMDYPTASQWFSQSAEKGNAHSQFQLARMLQNGEGVLKDEQGAQKLYALAFQGFIKMLKEEPDSGLQYKIGTMYEFGLGVEKNTNTAKQWFSASAETGNEYAADRLNQIESFEEQAAISSVMGLFRAFARNIGSGINDSTTHKYHQDRKLMQKQKSINISQRQKYDSQEQTM